MEFDNSSLWSKWSLRTVFWASSIFTFSQHISLTSIIVLSCLLALIFFVILKQNFYCIVSFVRDKASLIWVFVYHFNSIMWTTQMLDLSCIYLRNHIHVYMLTCTHARFHTPTYEFKRRTRKQVNGMVAGNCNAYVRVTSPLSSGVGIPDDDTHPGQHPTSRTVGRAAEQCLTQL